RGWAVGHTWTLTPTMTNEFNVGSTWNRIRIDSTGSGYTRAGSGVNLPLLYPNAVQSDFLPSISFAGKVANGVSFGNASDAPFINHNTTMDITDGLSKIWGRHAMKFGMYLQRSWKDQTSFGPF